jgi:hypothetical protein
MTSDELDSAAHEVEQADGGTQTRGFREYFRDEPHLPRDQHRRKPERAEGDDVYQDL